MKKWQLILGVTSLVILSSVQSTSAQTEDTAIVVEERKLTKEEKREAREARKVQKELEKSARKYEEFQQKQRNLVSIKESINDTLFVLEARNLYDRYGRSIPSNPTLNFIAVARDTLVLQVGSEFGLGPNGVGGITLEGHVSSYETTENPNQGNVSILMNVQSPLLGLATITIKITQTGAFRASVSGSWRQQIQMSGDFKSWETTKIFQGRTTRLIYGPY